MIQSRKQRCKAGCLLIRSAVPEDAAALLNLTRSVIAEERYQVTELSEFRTTVEQEEKWIRKISDSPDGLLLVAEARGEIIGMLNFHREKKKRLRHTGFFGMSVCKEWRGNKVGFTLLRTLLDWAKAHRVIEKVCLEVLADNDAAIALYHRLGFREEGRWIRQVKMGEGRYMDLIQMGRFVEEKEQTAEQSG
ncbi:hypothetical protein GCM10007416_10430 [Kroppenstedtia guangzhouensis]|jgi:RimJ/RimL family protein N-acetyltransferase|uniref:N-acetyltransferase domain-containing protein n=1 Tax=Kroppenstedtia guangzhouensis TaxID=1274356 RepID=A0ABQ1G9G5_9BACL|nr:GNAT family protein [Kroppenstedtia guangzhouensis]GGA39363.1 hypothetical protein GCM10007416_10430 [Kroppenstedtia guangzhouensis]